MIKALTVAFHGYTVSCMVHHSHGNSQAMIKMRSYLWICIIYCSRSVPSMLLVISPWAVVSPGACASKQICLRPPGKNHPSLRHHKSSQILPIADQKYITLYDCHQPHVDTYLVLKSNRKTKLLRFHVFLFLYFFFLFFFNLIFGSLHLELISTITMR